MMIFYEGGNAHTFKTTRINWMLQKLLEGRGSCAQAISVRKGKGRGPNFVEKNGRRVDVSQDYFVSNGKARVNVRIRSAGDSEETVLRNVEDARKKEADILIMATRCEDWITFALHGCDSKKRFKHASAVVDEVVVKRMSEVVQGYIRRELSRRSMSRTRNGSGR